MKDPRISTARKSIGSHRIPGVVYQWIKQNCAPSKILDFGCGYGQAKEYLVGFDWTGYDLEPKLFGEENPSLIRTWGATIYNKQRYNIVALSNVLNIQENWDDFTATLDEAAKQVIPGGIIVMNYPSNPRRMPAYDFSFMVSHIERHLNHSFNVVNVLPKQQIIIMQRCME